MAAVPACILVGGAASFAVGKAPLNESTSIAAASPVPPERKAALNVIGVQNVPDGQYACQSDTLGSEKNNRRGAG